MADLKIDVPTEMIDKVIKAQVEMAIISGLSKNSEALVTAVVQAALSEKKNSYERETLFSESCKAMIRDVALDVFKRWLADKEPLIREACEMRLKERGNVFIDEVAFKLCRGLAESFDVRVTLKVED